MISFYSVWFDSKLVIQIGVSNKQFRTTEYVYELIDIIAREEIRKGAKGKLTFHVDCEGDTITKSWDVEYDTVSKNYIECERQPVEA